MSKTQFEQAMHTWVDLFTHRSMRGFNHFAKSTGLSMPQFSIMLQVYYRGACGISDISQRFEITSAAASQLAEKLVHSGYLERTEDPRDRRARLLELSEKGRSLIGHGMHERYRWLDELTARLSEQDQRKITEALTILTAAAQKAEVVPPRIAARPARPPKLPKYSG
jgi:DNA-binding MarR family transcriptional regulator